MSKRRRLKKLLNQIRLYREGAGPTPYLVAAIEPGQALVLGHRGPDNTAAQWSDT